MCLDESISAQLPLYLISNYRSPSAIYNILFELDSKHPELHCI